MKVGDKAPDFTAATLEGKDVTLSTFIVGKKAVLVDFWASWCAPCRKEAKNIKAIYNDLHDKGFDVVGFSLDSNRDSWKRAVEEDANPWTQLSDLLAWKTPLMQSYSFKSIPTLILIDAQGTVVARDVRGDELREKVEEMCNK